MRMQGGHFSSEKQFFAGQWNKTVCRQNARWKVNLSRLFIPHCSEQILSRLLFVRTNPHTYDSLALVCWPLFAFGSLLVVHRSDPKAGASRSLLCSRGEGPFLPLFQSRGSRCHPLGHCLNCRRSHSKQIVEVAVDNRSSRAHRTEVQEKIEFAYARGCHLVGVLCGQAGIGPCITYRRLRNYPLLPWRRKNLLITGWSRPLS